MKFNIYQAMGRATKQYHFTKEQQLELHRRIFEDKPHDKARDSNGKYRAIMGYAKQLCKELDQRKNGIKMLHTPESQAVLAGVGRTADEVRAAKTERSLLKTSNSVAAIMEE